MSDYRFNFLDEFPVCTKSTGYSLATICSEAATLPEMWLADDTTDEDVILVLLGVIMRCEWALLDFDCCIDPDQIKKLETCYSILKARCKYGYIG